MPDDTYIPQSASLPEEVNRSLEGSLFELNIPDDLLKRAYRYPCRILDRHGNLLQTLSSNEQLEMYKEWSAKYISYGWTKVSLNRGKGG